MSLRLEIHERYQRWSVVRADVGATARVELHHACALRLRAQDWAGVRDLALVLLGFDFEDAQAWAALGEAYEGFGAFDRAEEAFACALRLRQDDAATILALARLLAARNAVEEALTLASRIDSAAHSGPVMLSLRTLRERLLSLSDEGR